ncbi:GntR family transcriptional regulator [Haploplasma axanthum]|uniref:GntR family transcriptional regulator n=1 Tax=Haploplasma axanthum TaxID=29552 RepID=UPI0003F90438|nr:GntR family transcriptional regulator [Haploplasma axanthum]
MIIDNNKPIYITIKEMIENMILKDILKEDEQVPSTTTISSEYNVNHITVLKAINLLVDEEIIYKKRGIGMYVSLDAKKIIYEKRKKLFLEEFINPLKKEADLLGISINEIKSFLDGKVNNDEN